MSDADLLKLERLARAGDPESEARLRHMRCQRGMCCEGHPPENPLPKGERFMFMAFRDGHPTGFTEWLAFELRARIAAHFSCARCEGGSPNCVRCCGGSYRDWKDAYRNGWRVRKVEIRPV